MGDNNMERKLKIFYDAEFTGLHKNTTPISIGLVSESGAYFYAEFTDYDKSQITDWINENVIKNLVLQDLPDGYTSGTSMAIKRVTVMADHANLIVKGNNEMIKSELLGWLVNESTCSEGAQIQFFVDCYAYDWVIMNNLIGKNGSALEIPAYVNYIPIDLSTAMYMRGIDPDVSREEFAGSDNLELIKRSNPFNTWRSGNIKHNCLWDAYICRDCFMKLPIIGFDLGIYDNDTKKDILDEEI